LVPLQAADLKGSLTLMLRLAVVCDLLEENWPSMDLVADMFLENVRAHHAAAVQATRVRPRMRRRLSRLAWLGARRAAFNGDRLVNRFFDYPRHLRRRVHHGDLFHVCDHSYAHLVHALPEDRTGVFCHDLDTFRCLLDPQREPRPRWFKAMARRILGGLQKAVVVFYSTTAVRGQIEAHGLLDPCRLVHAPYGIAPEFRPALLNPDVTADPVDGLDGLPFLLHVGSCIPRKRIDVLLEVFARVQARQRNLRLVQVGGDWTAEQRRQIERLGVDSAVIQRRGLSRWSLADLYRRAKLVLQPSEAEGFGLPVIEALGCGSLVVASDLPVLRELAGEAAVYCPIGDVPAWAETVDRLLSDASSAPDRSVRLVRAERYSWAAHTRTILDAYRCLTGREADKETRRQGDKENH
jgi:glycosyltransferase involved in cell wall biosynthesis